MSCAGNPVLKTPNLDQLARQGARFTSFYSACPVCVPARTAMLTGHSIESNHVLNNGDAERTDAPPFPSFDQILLRNGYRGEYHGKFHSPYQLALDYTQPGSLAQRQEGPPGSKAEISESEAFFNFVEAKRAGTPGEIRAVGQPPRDLHADPAGRELWQNARRQTLPGGNVWAPRCARRRQPHRVHRQGRSGRAGPAQGRAVHPDHFARSAPPADDGFRALLQPVSARQHPGAGQHQRSSHQLALSPEQAGGRRGLSQPHKYPADDFHLLRDGHRGG